MCPSSKPKTAALDRARLQHASENTADYLEAIADLIGEKGEARLIDVADKLGVRTATASRKISALQRDGFVRSERYRSIFLEPKGAKIAAESKKRHTALIRFLKAAGVPDEAAELDAEGIEHHVSEPTLRAFILLTKILEQAGGIKSLDKSKIKTR